MNYFELFQLPEDFILDPKSLTGTYRRLLQHYHPDNIAQTGLSELEATRLSGTINTAYDTLKSSAKRANHLLVLNKQDGGFDQSIGDVTFLGNALELREQLEDAQNATEIDAIKQEATQWLESLEREFLIDLNETDYSEARDTVRKLRFMESLIADLEESAHRLDTAFDDEQPMDLF